MSDVLVVFSTFPSADKAAEVAGLLIDEHLAACVNLIPGMTSIYRWQGGVARDSEVLAIIKTTRARWDELATRLAALHPYDVPEIVALEATAGAATYLDWVRGATSGTP